MTIKKYTWRKASTNSYFLQGFCDNGKDLLCTGVCYSMFILLKHRHLFSICKASLPRLLSFTLETVPNCRLSCAAGVFMCVLAHSFRKSAWRVEKSVTSNFFNLLFIALDQCFSELFIMISGKLNLLQFFSQLSLDFIFLYCCCCCRLKPN